MTRQTEISIMASSVRGAKYDEAAKENLQRPELIAPILKAVVPEYRNYTCEDIISFIVKDSICESPVDDVSTVANMMPTEQSSISEKLIRYDTRFKVINPRLSDKSISVYLHIDLEVQNDYQPTNPSYPIVKRGIYYGAREISSQLGILTETTNYDDIEKVYSIWICNENIPDELKNTVSSYRITKTDEVGVTDEKDSDYDLLHVIIIRRGNNYGNEEIFDYLTSFFNSDIDGICRHVDIRNNEEVMKGVKKMSGLGQSIYQEGVIETLINLVKKGMLTIANAAKEAQMSEEAFSELLKKSN